MARRATRISPRGRRPHRWSDHNGAHGGRSGRDGPDPRAPGLRCPRAGRTVRNERRDPAAARLLARSGRGVRSSRRGRVGRGSDQRLLAIPPEQSSVRPPARAHRDAPGVARRATRSGASRGQLALVARRGNGGQRATARRRIESRRCYSRPGGVFSDRAGGALASPRRASRTGDGLARNRTGRGVYKQESDRRADSALWRLGDRALA